MDKPHISYSAIRTFCNCRRAYRFRYVDRIESKSRPDYFSFGSLTHDCLEAHYKALRYNDGLILWHNGRFPKLIIDTNYPDRSKNNKQAQQHALSTAMMMGYTLKYPDDLMHFEVVATELEFDMPIINPATGRVSRKYTLQGKIDVVVKIDGKYWIMEHKTASQIDAGYLDRQRHDLQIALYAIGYEQMTGNKITGIIYNVLKKAGLRQGKTETIEAYFTRLLDKYKTDPEMFFRTEIYLDSRKRLDVKQELWDISQAMNTDNYFKNRTQCYVFGECEYFKICNSSDNPMVIQQYYKRREKDAITNREEQESDGSF